MKLTSKKEILTDGTRLSGLYSKYTQKIHSPETKMMKDDHDHQYNQTNSHSSHPSSHAIQSVIWLVPF